MMRQDVDEGGIMYQSETAVACCSGAERERYIYIYIQVQHNRSKERYTYNGLQPDAV